MKAKLIKTEKGFGLVSADKTQAIASTINPHDSLKLSLKNCQAIERGYDLDELAEQNWRIGLEEYIPTPVSHVTSFKAGFQKALELLGDKKFSEDDVRRAFSAGLSIGYGRQFEIENKQIEIDNYIQSLQQTEWDCIIEMEYNLINHASGLELTGHELMDVAISQNYKPKLDADGNLILKRK